ncbi:MAG: DEAD/DEAH box helicase [Deltaproteobacteria bacterium]|nr:DEAD/DEAH box helicase [Deltaproteobacteria bacterium]
MKKQSVVSEYLDSLCASKRLGSQVVFSRALDREAPQHAKIAGLFPSAIKLVLEKMGISSLYSHQAQAIKAILSGQNVVVSTPTASGKTLVYNLPVLTKIMEDQKTTAIYLFPLKALAQDQLRTFSQMAAAKGADLATAAIYDGDTSSWQRRKIRESLPNVIFTNPEMLHLSFLAYHDKWADFFSNLRYVVVDEVHTYRGVLGSHMAQVFSRLHRICRLYGANPVFIFSSATISNPVELVEALTGMPAKAVSKSGSPEGKRHLIFINPADSPATTAILLLKAALHRNLRTIVYTQSRKMAELISLWAGSQKGRFAGRISAYRAGYLPEERRELEQKLVSGELSAVISTSALELGIDIGDLDLCILVGFPGTVMATRQRWGRVGRGGKTSAMILIAGEDALDQYIMRNPEEFMSKPPESAYVNPKNPEILKKHLVCAASELPIRADESLLSSPEAKKAVSFLESDGSLLRSREGDRFYSARRSPHRLVNLRGTGTRFSIISSVTQEHMGEIDGFRAFHETHPGAIYLHQSKTFAVDNIDPETSSVIVSPARATYYTRVRAEKDTRIMEVVKEKQIGPARCCFGRLKVTDQVTGYEKISIRGGKRINIIDLNLPPQIFETEGLWIEIPPSIEAGIEAGKMHFMGGIHAAEHALIGISPFFILADRNDLGGISIPFHPQTGGAAIFIYDAAPGGIGLTRAAFERAEDLIEKTVSLISDCPCKNGCPACVHSPKCGSGNRPLDKEAAFCILSAILEKKVFSPMPRPDYNTGRLTDETASDRTKIKIPEKTYWGALDIETRRSAKEVGGWGNAHLMGVSCAILYDSRKNDYLTFFEEDVPDLVDHLQRFDFVVGFNIVKFDYRVLSGCIDFKFSLIKTIDILEHIHARLGYRLSLNHVATATLGVKKSADGLAALRWWKEGRMDEIKAYCKKDVEVTKDIFLYGRENNYLLFTNKAGHTVRIPVDWGLGPGTSAE